MRHTTALLVDCWSHDNNDDGYSDHQRCETVVIGGLYEYNVKGGLTPSYGAQDSYYNVYCRKQIKSGIALVGAAPPDEGGKGSQVYAYNCVCENNTDNYYVVGTGEQQDIPNTLVLISCRSIKASSAGYRAGTNGEMKLINCTDMESEITKYGTITICNGELVE